MQDYTKLDVTKPLKESIPAMQKSIDSVASNFSGTAFPTENVAVGMTCLRTDLDVLYICTALGTDGTPTWKEVIKTDIGAGSAETDSDGNVIKDTYLKQADAKKIYLPLSGGSMAGAIHMAKGTSTVYGPNGGDGEVGTVIDHPSADTIRIAKWAETAGSAGSPITMNVGNGEILAAAITTNDVAVTGNVTATGNVNAQSVIFKADEGKVDTIISRQEEDTVQVSMKEGGSPILLNTKLGLITCSDISASGNITGAKVFNAVYNDYAEFFPRGEETEPGDIIALRMIGDKELYEKATASSKVVVGVQSSEFAQVIGGDRPPNGEDFIEWNLARFIPVALAGRVHVKVKGMVKRGDYIIPSDEPGVGKVGRKNGNVIGRSLQNDNHEGVKKIRVLVGR